MYKICDKQRKLSNLSKTNINFQLWDQKLYHKKSCSKAKIAWFHTVDIELKQVYSENNLTRLLKPYLKVPKYTYLFGIN